MNKKQTVYVLAIILAIIQIFFGKNNLFLTSNPDVQTPKLGVSTILYPTSTVFLGDKQTAFVTRVIDGDTIEIEGKKKVRYIGINSPEIYRDTTGKKTGEQCFANQSYLENKRLVEGKIIRMEKDVSETDKYGRLLRFVYINNTFVNEYLILNGYAKIMTVKPDTKFSQQFKIDEKEAKENDRGLWKECPLSVSNRKKGQ